MKVLPEVLLVDQNEAFSLEMFRQAFQRRESLYDQRHEAVFRLFSGFYEGCPDLSIDLYGKTVLYHWYGADAGQAREFVQPIQNWVMGRLPWTGAAVLKMHRSPLSAEKQGQLISGAKPDEWVRENGLRYAIQLMLNQDASFYLDTRNLRAWARNNLQGLQVLNIFAYTGSLGAAAVGGGAQRVIQLDRNREFLNLAKRTYTLNGFPIRKEDFISGDFWPITGRMRRQGSLFDCVILDPPFFSDTGKGRVDLLAGMQRLINKARPLVRDGGWLVAVNNALYLSGSEYMGALEEICNEGYLEVARLIPVPEDVTGYPETTVRTPPVDPAPFNHPTKIAILKVKRKDGQKQCSPLKDESRPVKH